MSRHDGEAAPPFDPAADGWEPVDDKGFLGLVGPTWRRLREDRLEFAFRAEPKHANLRNVVQGGMLMTFADRALGRNSWRAAGEKPVATVEFNMQFVTAGRSARSSRSAPRSSARRARSCSSAATSSAAPTPSPPPRASGRFYRRL